MTEREREVYEILKRNPTIGQSELAELLHISRSSAAVHIANLQKKGYVLGKGYILNEESYIVGVGAANVDVHGKSRAPIVMKDSNPGSMHSSVGGVTRNVCENLSRLGTGVKLISAVGDDVYADMIRRECLAAGIDISGVYTVYGHPSSTYISILDEKGDMLVALSDMSVLRSLPKEHLKAYQPTIAGAAAVTCDPSLPVELIEYLLDLSPVPVCVDPVSTAYAKAVYDLIGRFDTVKPNLMEAEILSDTRITDERTLNRAAGRILAKGVKRVLVSMGDKGCFYKDQSGLTLRRALRPVRQMVNATGAGDAFMAGFLSRTVAGDTPKQAVDFALGAGIVALLGENTINEKMSQALVYQTLKEYSK